jgi:hypothetical protein
MLQSEDGSRDKSSDLEAIWGLPVSHLGRDTHYSDWRFSWFISVSSDKFQDKMLN